jgi:hypothetical protein
MMIWRNEERSEVIEGKGSELDVTEISWVLVLVFTHKY